MDINKRRARGWHGTGSWLLGIGFDIALKTGWPSIVNSPHAPFIPIIAGYLIIYTLGKNRG